MKEPWPGGSYNIVLRIDDDWVLRIPRQAASAVRDLAERQCDIIASLRSAGFQFLPSRRLVDGPQLLEVLPEGIGVAEWAIIEQYVAGCELRIWLTEADPDIADRRSVALNLSKAISVLHAAGVTHGDLSSTNLRVGYDLQVSLLDLDTLQWGTAPPRPPELEGGSTGYLGPPGSDLARDQFALAVLLWEIFTSDGGALPPLRWPSMVHCKRMVNDLDFVDRSLGALLHEVFVSEAVAASSWVSAIEEMERTNDNQ